MAVLLQFGASFVALVVRACSSSVVASSVSRAREGVFAMTRTAAGTRVTRVRGCVCPAVLRGLGVGECYVNLKFEGLTSFWNPFPF